MKLMRATPTYGTMKQDLDRMFDRFFEPSFWPVTTPKSLETLWEPVLDFSETDKEYVIRLEAPGMTRDDFDVDLDRTLLTLSGKREFNKEEKGEDYIWRERQEGRFLRSIRLPAAVVEDKIDAAYANGILTVKLPKAQPAAKTKVAVK